jgi:PrcB C-terminal
MTPRSLCYLALLSTAACGSGRLVPAEAPEPSAPAPVAAPEPAAEPTPVAPPPSAAPAPDGAAPYAPYDASGSLPIRRIGQWTTSGIYSPERTVLRNDSTYARFWEALGVGQRPAVDFSRDVVIAVAAGQRPTGGHAIAVERVARVGKAMMVEVVETVPGPGCWTAQQVTQPVDVVVVAAADAQEWSFSDRTRSQPCG